MSLPTAGTGTGGSSASEGAGRGRGRGRARALQGVPEPGGQSEDSTRSPEDSSSTGKGASGQKASSTHSSESTSTGGQSGGTTQSRETSEAKIEAAGIPLALRPDEGNKLSRPLQLRANHFPVILQKSVKVHHYSVNISHERLELKKDELIEVFWKTVKQQKNLFPNFYGIVFDGGKQVFSIMELELPNGSSGKIDVEVGLKGRPPQKCSLEFSLLASHNLKFDRDSPKQTQFSILCADVVVRASRSNPFIDTDFVSAGRSFYRPPGRPREMDLTGGLEAWCGYFCSVHLAQGNRPLLNIDSTYTAFYQKQPVIDFLCDVMSRGRDARGGGPWTKGRVSPDHQVSPTDAKIFEKAIKGLQVTVIHRAGEEIRRTYKVRSVTPTSAADTRFTSGDRDGQQQREMSVADYFAQTYQRLRYPRLPCLACGSKSRAIYFPLEVCEIKGGQKSLKKINEDQTSKMIRIACKDAQSREVEIREMAHAAGLNGDNFASNFGVSFEPRMVEFEGRQLEPPTLAYGNDRTVMPDKGAWDLRGIRMHTPGAVKGWGIMCFLRQDQRTQQMLEGFSVQLYRAATAMGMMMDEWPESIRFVQRPTDVEFAMRDIIGEVERRKGDKDSCGLVLICVPGRTTDIYAEVKRCGDTRYGCATQVVQFKTVSNPKPATMSNITLKINAKVGGVNNLVADDRHSYGSSFMLKQPTLILGIDVTHPSPMERSSQPSIGAVVGNIDNFPAKFGASVAIQRKRREAVIFPEDAVRQRLVHYYKCTNRKPERIIVYRDGVSEGQFKQVLEQELSCIKRVCNNIEDGYRPKITFVVVQKRHHTRFFCRSDRDMCGRAKNVPPGTVVDTEITHPQTFDFFLCSHFGIQGTSRPAHYYVIYDENQFGSAAMQTITYQLCHLYYRCSRAVSIPAPVYYAHLVAQRAKYHMQHKFGDWSDSGSVTSAGQPDDEAQEVALSEMVNCVRLAKGFENRMYFA